MSATKLPTGWRVELLGLINAVQFTKGRQQLMWCDGQWTIGTERMHVPARGVPDARTQAEARKVGAAFIIATEDDDQ